MFKVSFVCGQPTTARTEIQSFGCDMNVDTGIRQFGDHRPVPKVAGRTVDLVHDEASCRATLQLSDHLVEDGATPLGGGFLLLKPPNDVQILATRKSHDGVSLRVE
jgi:hypothetical protein